MTERGILITGASGLIGQTLLARLRADGRRATGVDLVARPGRSPVEIVDLADIHRLHAIADRDDIGSVIHCGAVSGPMVMVDNPYGILQVNVVGTANVLELARQRSARRFVFCSSTSAFGPTHEPSGAAGVPEDVAPRPSSVYGATKVMGEQMLAGYRAQHGVDGVAVRLSWVYGPGRTTDCVIRGMIEDARAGRATRLPWGRDFARQFIHVDDAVDALLAAHDAEACPRAVYTATGGTYHTLGEIAEIVAEVLGGADIELLPGPDPLDDIHHRFDIGAIARDLGFRPRRSLAEGIRGYAAWLRENQRTA
ncbi:MAG: NAD-dependent dehydratase [Rhodovulum sulfidophilum]|uniref:NAD-dependent dehydratase n=1 Tax=Rhodovulum sulfidophilum TaxID=35806 RepID=A0A2W5N0P2_RHOSU|nr:MAG: NAD-dependent dehydratase [Rhodovulum sulfidophilum]